MAIFQTKLRMSTAYHPQADGQAEKASSVISNYLKAYAATEPSWGRRLALAEFCYNSTKHKAMGMKTVEADLVYNPRLPLSIAALSPRTSPAALSFAEHMSVT